MARFKTYAVVDAETGEVISQFLEDMVGGSQMVKKNGLTMAVVIDGCITEVKKVNLSTTQGNTNKIINATAPERCIQSNGLYTGKLGEVNLIQVIP